MPIFNNRGDAACGGAGTGPSYNGKRLVVPTKFNADGKSDEWIGGNTWVDDDHILYQHCTHPTGDVGCALYTVNIHTKKIEKVASRGANFAIGGGGRWAAWLGDFGIFGAIESTDGGLVRAGRDGTFAIVEGYHSWNGVSLYALDGRVTYVDHAERYGVCVLGPTSMLWTVKGEIFALNARVPQQVAPAGNPKLVNVNGEDWIVYWAGTGSFAAAKMGLEVDHIGLIAHPANDASEGYLIENRPIAYNHDAVAVDGKLWVCYSTGEGELPEELVVRKFTLKEPRIKFREYRPILKPEERQFSESSSAKVGNKTETIIVQPQLGLLEDDLVYRLSLLAVNVLEPLKAKYPNIVIRSGLRQVNSGIGQHESGEAVDLQINNQTTELLWEVAKWIEGNLNFDQLILNFTNLGDGQPWIHVSFSPNSLRQQVLTKDYADEFHDGLHIVTPLSGEEAAAALRAADQLDKLIYAEMVKMQNRSVRALPATSVQDEVSAAVVTSAGTLDPNSGGGQGGGDNNPGRARLVACVQSALGLRTNDDIEHNARVAFETVKRVAWMLRDEGCGLLIGPSGGENVVEWNGYIFRAGRVCYPDGSIYKLMTDVDGGAHSPGWVSNGVVDPNLYVPAMDPGAEYNTNWLTCAVPAPEVDQSETGPTVTGDGTNGGGLSQDNDPHRGAGDADEQAF